MSKTLRWKKTRLGNYRERNFSTYLRIKRDKGVVLFLLNYHYYSCRLLLPLARPPPRLCLLCAFFLCLLESELFSFAAFLSTCLLPFDLPTMVNLSRRMISIYIPISRPVFDDVLVQEKKTTLFDL